MCGRTAVAPTDPGVGRVVAIAKSHFKAWRRGSNDLEVDERRRRIIGSDRDGPKTRKIDHLRERLRFSQFVGDDLEPELAVDLVELEPDLVTGVGKVEKRESLASCVSGAVAGSGITERARVCLRFD